MTAIQSGEDAMVVVGKIFGAGGFVIAAFLVGGLVMGTAAAIPSYFIFLRIFRSIRLWREARRKLKN